MADISELNEKIPQRRTKIQYKNAIGDRGELLAASRLTEGYIFECYLLGGKTPIFDLMLKISDKKHPFFALVQVKTRCEKVAKGGLFNIKIESDKIVNLQRLGMPTYLIGVEEATETLYLVPVYSKTKKCQDYIKGIPTKIALSPTDHKKNIENLIKLKNDIIAYSTPISKRKLLYKTKLKV